MGAGAKTKVYSFMTNVYIAKKDTEHKGVIKMSKELYRTIWATIHKAIMLLYGRNAKPVKGSILDRLKPQN